MSKIELTGFNEVIANLDGITDIPTEVAARALQAGAAVIFDEILANAPERSGRMKEEIRIKKASLTGKVKSISIAAGGFASLVEDGHGGPKPAPPHPFVYPSYEAKKDDAQTEMEGALRDWLDG